MDGIPFVELHEGDSLNGFKYGSLKILKDSKWRFSYQGNSIYSWRILRAMYITIPRSWDFSSPTFSFSESMQTNWLLMIVKSTCYCATLQCQCNWVFIIIFHPSLTCSIRADIQVPDNRNGCVQYPRLKLPGIGNHFMRKMLRMGESVMYYIIPASPPSMVIDFSKQHRSSIQSPIDLKPFSLQFNNKWYP